MARSCDNGFTRWKFDAWCPVTWWRAETATDAAIRALRALSRHVDRGTAPMNPGRDRLRAT